MQRKERISCPDPSGPSAFVIGGTENGCRRITNWCPSIVGRAAVVVRGGAHHGEVLLLLG